MEGLIKEEAIMTDVEVHTCGRPEWTVDAIITNRKDRHRLAQMKRSKEIILITIKALR